MENKNITVTTKWSIKAKVILATAIGVVITVTLFFLRKLSKDE